jgi:simple sugar transport system ATP-binding protein
MTYRLELKDISKSFGDVQSLSHVNFHVDHNEVVGLLGDNGAGKSTLIKIVTGYYQPDSGELNFNGEKVDRLTVPKARKLGVETVYQERALADQQTLWRNIFMGRELSAFANGSAHEGSMKPDRDRPAAGGRIVRAQAA